MHINVVFGSQSDKPVYEPLCTELKNIPGVTVTMEVCSAHREPERLRKLIAKTPCDLYIAGAGLAAHLPGVIASQTSTPVIGIPCNDILQGYDALLSTVQMPKGVPVMSTGVNNTEAIVKFIKWYVTNREQPPTFCIHAPAWADQMVKQLRSPLEKLNWQFVDHVPDVDHPPAIFSLVLHDLFTPNQPVPGLKNGIWLGAPVFAQPPYEGDLKAMGAITGSGGLWVGINNITNLQLSLLQLWPVSNKERLLLQELQGGEKQSVR